MCGIAGLYNYCEPLKNQLAMVEDMCSRIVHRGPNSSGLWADNFGRCSLGHRRLAIIDPSSAGHQPMTFNNGEWVITFNGEIYNFKELRVEIESNGVQLKGRTDTEILLAAISLWGTDALN